MQAGKTGEMAHRGKKRKRKKRKKKKNLGLTSPLIDLGGGVDLASWWLCSLEPLSGVSPKNLQSSLVGFKELEELVMVAWL